MADRELRAPAASHCSVSAYAWRSYEPFLRDAVTSYIKQVNPQFYHATTAGSSAENGPKKFWLSIYDLPQVEK